MNRTKVVVGFVKSVYWAARLAGLCPFHFVADTKTFRTSPTECIYSIVFWLCFTGFYITSGILDLIQLTPVLFSIYVIVILTTIAIVYVYHCAQSERIAKFATDSVKLFCELNQCYNVIENIPSCRPIRLLCVKLVIVDAIMYLTTVKFCIRFSMQVTGSIAYRGVVASTFAIFIRETISNMYFIYILIVSLYFTIINDDIERTMHRSKLIMGHKHTDAEVERLLRRLSQIAQSLCRLSDQVRRFNEIFSCEILVMYIELVSSPLIEVIVQNIFQL